MVPSLRALFRCGRRHDTCMWSVLDPSFCIPGSSQTRPAIPSCNASTRPHAQHGLVRAGPGCSQYNEPNHCPACPDRRLCGLCACGDLRVRSRLEATFDLFDLCDWSVKLLQVASNRTLLILARSKLAWHHHCPAGG